MNTMMLLKAMSEIAPEDIEAALRNAPENPDAAETLFDAAEHPGFGGVTAPEIRRRAFSNGTYLRYGGWIAAAACLLLVVGAVLYFHQDRSGWMLAASSSEQVTEITEAETTAAATGHTAESAAHTAETGSAVTTTKFAAATEQSQDSTVQTVSQQVRRTEPGQTAADTEPTTSLPPDTTEPPRTTTVSTEASVTTTESAGTEPVYTLPEVEILNPFENGGMEPNTPEDVVRELSRMPEGSFVFRQFREPEEAYNTHLRNHLEQNRDVIAVYTISDLYQLELHSWEVTDSGCLKLTVVQFDHIPLPVKGCWVFLISKPDGELPEISGIDVKTILKPLPEVQE